MNDNDKKKWKINLSMADGTFPAWIDPEDEEIVRKAAKLVDQSLESYRKKWPSDIPKEKILAIVAYEFALKALKYENRNDTEPYRKKIDELATLLDEYLKQ